MFQLFGGLGDWVNFVFFGKFLKKLGRFLFWVIFYFFWAKKPENLLFLGRFFTIGLHWIFKSMHLATNNLYSMLENF